MGSGVSVVRRSEINLYTSMNVRRIGAAGIGVQWIIDAGFIDAIDVWGDDVQGEACMDGVGRLLFLDASASPRAQSWLESYQRDGRTCAELAGPGTVVLLPVASASQLCRAKTTGNVKLRARASTDSEVIGYVRRGTTLKTLSRSGKWIEIEHLGRAGWISGAYVGDDCAGPVNVASSKAAEEGGGLICITGDLRVRAGPSLDADTMGFLRSGVRLRALSRRGNWIEIEYQDRSGWIGAEYVSDDCGGSVDAQSSRAVDEAGRICTTGGIRVRAGPSLDADTVGFVRRGVMLRVLSRRQDWIEITYQGEAGWIGANYASEDCGESVGPAPSATQVGAGNICTIGDLRVRASPSPDADTIGFVRRGVPLRALSRRGHWIEIAYQGGTGWIGAHYVSGDCG